MRWMGGLSWLGLLVASTASAGAPDLDCLSKPNDQVVAGVLEGIELALEDLESQDKYGVLAEDIAVLEEAFGTILGGPIIGTAIGWTWVTETGIGLCVTDDARNPALVIRPDLEDPADEIVIDVFFGRISE